MQILLPSDKLNIFIISIFHRRWQHLLIGVICPNCLVEKDYQNNEKKSEHGICDPLHLDHRSELMRLEKHIGQAYQEKNQVIVNQLLSCKISHEIVRVNDVLRHF